MVPDSVTITGPRRVVNTVSSVSTVDQTVTVRDSGDFLIPLDVKRLAAGVRVQPDGSARARPDAAAIPPAAGFAS